jgi:hypothetical protein
MLSASAIVMSAGVVGMAAAVKSRVLSKSVTGSLMT